MRAPTYFLSRMYQPPASTGRVSHLRRYLVLTSLVALLALLAGTAGCSPFAGGAHSAATSASSHSVSSQTPPPSPVESQLASDVLRGVWSLGVKKLATTYNPQKASAAVTITLGGAVPTTEVQVSAAQELTKAYCLMALQALWASGVPLSQTTVVVLGPTQDEYADLVNQTYGAVTLGSVTARRIGWAHVTADTAWKDYPDAFLRGSYVVVD